MEKAKIFRDPIYGYVEIPEKTVSTVVDSPSFQRLRRIIQTSYSPLYASALHNRFVHSLGVYHLGNIAANQLAHEIQNINKEFEVEKYKELFGYACLLHDVGHAPFSHTGEQYYISSSNPAELDDKMKELVGAKSFAKKIKNIKKAKSTKAAPHEIMSVIVALKQYKDLFKNFEEREFFARCITGYRYKSINSDAKFKNCFISLLNSSVIDVDKLDYLIRDAYTTGFNTVNIDYRRLLTSIALTTEGDDYIVAYTKRAINVIENVVYARDSEKKWLQTHPVTLYESYLLDNAMRLLEKKAKAAGQRFFSQESISPEGSSIGSRHVKLLCDDDVICEMKALDSALMSEFFDRRLRRHPIWKSEAEYNDICSGYVTDGKLKETFEVAMDNTVKYLETQDPYGVVNVEVIEKIRKDISSDIKTKDKIDRSLVLKIINVLKEFADENDMGFDFVIIRASQFISGFGKVDFENLPIIINTDKSASCRKFCDIVPSLRPSKSIDNSFYYIYYRRGENKKSEIDESKKK